MTTFGFNRAMVRLNSHSIRYYKELCNAPNIRSDISREIAAIALPRQSQMDGYRDFASTARYVRA